MKKILVILLVAVFCLAFVGCDEDESACTEEDANQCADEYLDCVDGLDATSSTYADDVAACQEDWCDCLDAQGCDEYLEEAGCE